ncbi:MAG TPA: hypothetical protein VIK35_11240 [Verrucomicrobiae bacterium]
MTAAQNNSAPARRNKLGRPEKFTAATRRRLVTLIAAGVPVCHACAAARVSKSGFHEYKKSHPEFFVRIEQAVGKAIEKHLRNIIAASKTDPANSRWLLERCHPQHFGRTRIKLTGENGSPLAVGVAIYLPRKDGEEIKPLPAAAIENEN